MKRETLLVLVHPFFTQFSEHHRFYCKPLQTLASTVRTNPSNGEQLRVSRRLVRDYPGISVISMQGYLLRLQRLLEVFADTKILLAEEGPYISACLHLIKRMGHSAEVLVYETKYADPRPLSGNWQEVADLVRWESPEHLLVAGQRSSLPSSGSNGQLTQCVPWFVSTMRQHLEPDPIKVTMSPVVYPNWKKETQVCSSVNPS